MELSEYEIYMIEQIKSNLLESFEWIRSPQGWKYWQRVYTNLDQLIENNSCTQLWNGKTWFNEKKVKDHVKMNNQGKGINITINNRGNVGNCKDKNETPCNCKDCSIYDIHELKKED